MASTDTRSGFRLPWSSDRSHEDAAAEAAGDAQASAHPPAVTEAEPAAPADGDPGWPAPDFNAALGLTRTEQRPLEATASPTAEREEPSPMVDMDTRVPAPAAAPRKPSRIMVDLSAAIRATADAAQAQTVDQVRSDSTQVVDAIRASASDGVTTLRQQSEDDIFAIREWSKAEIARIKEETDARITTRKATLEDELAGHAAAVERRVDQVHAEVRRFEASIAAYRERLERESDPSRLATMAEELPETPSFAAWSDLGTLDISAAAPAVEVELVETQPTHAVAPDAGEVEASDIAQDVTDTLKATAPVQEVAPVDDWYAPADETAATDTTSSGWVAADAWADSPELQPAASDGETTDEGSNDVPRWTAGETPEGFPTDDSAEG
ncbi:MAG TPA: hypothetical protein VKB30_04600, partial [Candidatus Limnocylindrales bacterium]|nr:hypothetical protein [Candidatus Limnocylindrales bacterium]